jgi:LAO/AO transport system kinase
VARVADVTALVLAPGFGDDIQVIKAGVMEIADVFVLNKADEPGIEKLEKDCRDAGRPVVRCVALTGEGVAAVLAAVRGNRLSRDASVQTGVFACRRCIAIGWRHGCRRRNCSERPNVWRLAKPILTRS